MATILVEAIASTGQKVGGVPFTIQPEGGAPSSAGSTSNLNGLLGIEGLANTRYTICTSAQVAQITTLVDFKVVPTVYAGANCAVIDLTSEETVQVVFYIGSSVPSPMAAQQQPQDNTYNWLLLGGVLATVIIIGIGYAMMDKKKEK